MKPSRRETLELSATALAAYAGQRNTFTDAIELKEAGEYVVDVFAYDPANGNTGVSRAKIRAQ